MLLSSRKKCPSALLKIKNKLSKVSKKDLQTTRIMKDEYRYWKKNALLFNDQYKAFIHPSPKFFRLRHKSSVIVRLHGGKAESMTHIFSDNMQFIKIETEQREIKQNTISDRKTS